MLPVNAKRPQALSDQYLGPLEYNERMVVVEVIFAVVVAAVVLGIAAVAVRASRHGGFRLAFYGHDVLYKRTCEWCTKGLQYQAADRSWGPMTGHRSPGLPAAPSRDCRSCNGMGFYLDAAEQVTLPPAR